MAFTQKDKDALLSIPENSYLNKPTKEKYKNFKQVDPFPDIPDALLNSADIVKYILTTGMIDPFNSEKLEGATYTCEFSGDYIFWDEYRIKHKKKLPDDGKLNIKPNSIVFLGIDALFSIPQYIALRFNLTVKNAYKGLLLGTGPIVDPGYVGKLFIPLHNFTSNEYYIKPKADLIAIEFTKLSKNDEWDIKSKNAQMNIVNSLNFASVQYIPKFFKSPRLDIDSYIEESLIGISSFAKKGMETPFVYSSMAEQDKKINLMEEIIKENIEKQNKNFDSMKKNIKEKIEDLSYLKVFFGFTIASVIIAALSLFATTGWYFSNATKLSEAMQNINRQQEVYDKDKADFEKLIADLQKRIEDLEKFNISSGDDAP